MRVNPDAVARWACVVCGCVLLGAMVAGAVLVVATREWVQSTTTFAGGIILGMALVWYGSRPPARTREAQEQEEPCAARSSCSQPSEP